MTAGLIGIQQRCPFCGQSRKVFVQSRVNFAGRLKALRERSVLEQKELADMVAVNKSQISQYERGELEPSLSTLRRLVEALGVSPNDLLC